MDLNELSVKYLNHCSARGMSTTTVKTYRSVFRRTWEITCDLGVELDTEALDEEWADFLVEVLLDVEKMKAATVHRNIGALRGMFRFARQKRWTKNDPFINLELPDKRQTDRVQFTIEELNAIAEATAFISGRQRQVMFRALFLLQFAIGTRVGELLKLRPCDLDFDAGMVRIVKGKGAKTREVPFDQRAAEALRDWLRVRQDWLETRKGDLRICSEEPEGLWLADRGRCLSRAGVYRCLDELKSIAGAREKFRIHDLRAMTAQHWKRSGVDLESIQVWLGHSDLSTTKIYVRDAAADTRRWRQFCGLPPAGEQTSSIPAPTEPAVVAPAASSAELVTRVVEALQVIQAAQPQPLLHGLLAGSFPVQAACAPAQPGLAQQLLAMLLCHPAAPAANCTV